MNTVFRGFACVALVAALVHPTALLAKDVDGPDDCQRSTLDMGDAPENMDAYPGILGHFPTCLAPSAPGTQELQCAPISTPPGPTGFVRNFNPTAGGFWLGCPPTGVPPMGIDSETDGKVSPGGPTSICNPSLAVDCFEAAFSLSFGQDECYGSDDAGLSAPPVFNPCATTSVTFQTYNCQTTREVYLNILVDWNQDGDWNDNFLCPGGTACAYEWAVKNALIVLPPGCATLTSPSFLVGPNVGDGWMRITISTAPAPDDFPWNGSAAIAGESLRDGETEDYPVSVVEPDPCQSDYEDFGDAPEEIDAYPGVIGHFPTCIFPSGPGTQELQCTTPPLSTPPGLTGYVRHVRPAADPIAIWLGCGTGAPPTLGIDSEIDGKLNLNPAPGTPSVCNSAVLTDCVEPAFGMTFGQDECYGDLDAGVSGAVSFTTCTSSTLTYSAFNCSPTTVQAFVNVLVDWNRDGDWNDDFICPQGCAYEWVVKNATVVLTPGCQVLTTPSFLAGPFPGDGWMRITLTLSPVPDDFPWAGSAGLAQGFFRSGETEDYPVTIAEPNPCEIGYRDFGDAPEEITAYPSGVAGHFPTCQFPGAPGTQELDCNPPFSTPPGPTGYVEHRSLPTDAYHFWFGCGLPTSPLTGIDGEADGKVNLNPPGPGTPSVCNANVLVDCVEPAFGAMSFGQDECYGDADSGVPGPVTFGACSTATVRFQAYNCSNADQQVYLNVLVDWNQDGDWNDNAFCLHLKTCAPEWAVKNVVVTLPPGCSTHLTPTIQVGPKVGHGWMRMTMSLDPAPDDFPWNGSVGTPTGVFHGGETEDYPVEIEPSLVGVVPGEDFGGLWLSVVSPVPGAEGTTIRFGLPRESEVSVSVYDVTGRLLRRLDRGRYPAGVRTLRWDFRDGRGRAVETGIFIIKLEANGTVIAKQAIRLR